MLKESLRSIYLKRRKNISAQQLIDADLCIANNLLRLSVWEFSNYHVFLSITEKKEIDTTPILSIIQGKDKNIVVPKMNEDGTLSNYLLTDNTTLVKNKWNVPEPIDGIEISEKKLDVVFVPLLAFDKAGHRVGYGKGFYDRFLSNCRPDIIKIGLSYFEAEEEISDIEENDVPLDYCVTPTKIYYF
ncbi:5-formyltetrahydrofolate cyclo-ligase [uncultured Kriegella sp.]|uniref:5-formyltetrahydrofolate cyclo-ligase n=1 Tax=uncultured Kriegella sp. TaxID=1798910 RepID=UPI0030D70CB6|tara:strand:+ start:252722 stop:253282 length:561 start_codon:yes stop_codon:yes gene_type:complete